MSDLKNKLRVEAHLWHAQFGDMAIHELGVVCQIAMKHDVCRGLSCAECPIRMKRTELSLKARGK
jgi:hypothetical protein